MDERLSHLSFVLHGQRLTGRFGLTKTGQGRCLMTKASDEHAGPGSEIVAERPQARSAASGSRSRTSSGALASSIFFNDLWNPSRTLRLRRHLS